MYLRTPLGVLAAVALLTALPEAASAAPLAGKGVNIEPVATIQIDDSQKNELELAGDYAYVDHDDGMDIVDISNPANPKTVGEVKCKGSGGDIDISPDATIAVRATAHGTPCKEGGTAATIIDISDKTNPKIIGKVDLDPDMVFDYVHTVTLDKNLVYLNPQTAAFYPQDNVVPRIRIIDIKDPRNPKEVGQVKATPGIQALTHDSFVDHRPDGKSLLYGASVHTTDVFDVTDPLNSSVLQRTVTPDSTISHQAQPNFDRSLLIMADESAVGDNQAGWTCGKGGTGPAAMDVGSTHFFALSKDGTLANQGVAPVGSFNTGPRVTKGYCTAHVFWPAPDQNRLVQAWYSEGARVIDFSDPANPKELGNFVADKPTMYWSAKPHRGYIFATDMDRGLDVLRYTGEGGKKWPTTAGPAEIQRSGFQGMPYVPLKGVSRNNGPLPAPKQAPGSSGSGSGTATTPGTSNSTQRGGIVFGRRVGRLNFSVKLKGLSRKRRNVLNLRFYNAKGKRVGSVVRFKKRGAKARTTRIKVSGIAVAGKYRWTLHRGKSRKAVKRGTFTVKAIKDLTLSQRHTIYAKAR